MKVALWIAAGLTAALGTYLALNGAGPLWTLLAGIAVGALLAAASRADGGSR